MPKTPPVKLSQLQEATPDSSHDDDGDNSHVATQEQIDHIVEAFADPKLTARGTRTAGEAGPTTPARATPAQLAPPSALEAPMETPQKERAVTGAPSAPLGLLASPIIAGSPAPSSAPNSARRAPPPPLGMPAASANGPPAAFVTVPGLGSAVPAATDLAQAPVPQDEGMPAAAASSPRAPPAEGSASGLGPRQRGPPSLPQLAKFAGGGPPNLSTPFPWPAPAAKAPVVVPPPPPFAPPTVVPQQKVVEAALSAPVVSAANSALEDALAAPINGFSAATMAPKADGNDSSLPRPRAGGA